MNSPAVDIASLLAGSGIGTLGMDLFASRLPGAPDTVTAVMSTASRQPQISTGVSTFKNIDRPNVQVLVRVPPGQQSAGYAKAETVKNILHGKGVFVSGGARYISTLAVSDIGELGTDEKGRPVYSINFAIERSTT